MVKLFNFFGVVLVCVLCLGLASANIVIAGKVYTAGFGETVAGAELNVTCNEQTFSTLSLGDGSYSVIFEVDSCDFVEVESDYTVAQVVSEADGPYDEVASENLASKQKDILTGAVVDMKNDVKNFFVTFWWIFALVGVLGISFFFVRRKIKKSKMCEVNFFK